MKQLTKNTRAYSAPVHMPIPALNALNIGFEPIGSSQLASYGLVKPHDDADGIFAPVLAGWCTKFREDRRVIPAKEIKRLLKKAISDVEADTGRKVGKKERAQLREDVVADLLPRTLPRTTETLILYSAATQTLYLDTTSQKTADTIMSMLVNELESLRTTTIHVSDVAQGLTARLKQYFSTNDGASDLRAFGEKFEPSGDVTLTLAGRKWVLKQGSLLSAEGALREALAAGAQVASMGFTSEFASFTLDASLRVKSIGHRVASTDDDVDVPTQWQSQIISEVAALDAIYGELVHLFNPERIQNDAAGAVADPFAADDLF